MSTVRQRLSAFFMRGAGGGILGTGAGEPNEFEEKYARLLRARDTLKKVEASTKIFLKKAKSLGKAAKGVGLAVGTPDAEVKKHGEDINATFEDDKLIKAISAKVQLLDDTVKQRRRLDELKGLRDHHSARLQQIKSKRAAGSMDDVKLHVEEAKWQAKLEHSQREYDEVFQELTEALDFIDAQTKVDGPWSLVGPELDAFRINQSKLFKGMESMFVGAPAGSYRRDPLAEQEAVEAQKALESSQQTDPPSTPNSSHTSTGPGASTVETSSPDKKDAHKSSRPKPPRPPGAESEDDDDDDDDL